MRCGEAYAGPASACLAPPQEAATSVMATRPYQGRFGIWERTATFAESVFSGCRVRDLLSSL